MGAAAWPTPSELVVIGLLAALILLGVAAMLRLPPRPPGAGFRIVGGELEARLAGMPQPADLKAISDRLNAVERIVDVVRTEVGAMKDALDRVDRTTGLLLRQQLGTKE